MAEKVGNDESDLGSVTSSQISFLKNCPFADPLGGVKEDNESDTTEVLETPISAPVTRTPILSLLTTPISLDSINDEDVFRTPPENASLSSAADSEPKPLRGGGGGSESESKSKSPNPRVLEVTPPLSSPPSLGAKSVTVTEKQRGLDSSRPSATEGDKVNDSGEIEIPFKEVIEALLRNGGENLVERDERVSYVNILKQFGVNFP